MRKIYLASSSRWRASILKSAGIVAELRPPMVDEESILGADPVETARLRARAKASFVWSRVSEESIVIAADQVVYLDGEIFGKPKTAQAWLDRLQKFRGRGHNLTTAMCVWSKDVKKEIAEHSIVHFRSDVSQNELQTYINYGEASGCAGGYMVESRGAWLIEKVEGDWQNVVGLPIFRLISALRGFGYTLADVIDSEVCK